MKIKGVNILLLVFVAVFFITAWSGDLCNASNSPAALLKNADRCQKYLYSSSNKMKYRHNWFRCIKQYERIYTQYPDSEEAAWALYRSAGLFNGLYRYSWSAEDLDESIKLYRRLADKYKDHRLADDAQYKIGEIFYKYKKDEAHAYVEFLKLDIKFPSGDMRPRARKMLDKLAVLLSKKDEKMGKAIKNESESGLIAVKDIRHWSTPNYTRVVIDLYGPVKYTYNLLKEDPDLNKPRRLYLDLEGACVTSDIDKTIAISDGLLQKARAAQYKKDTVRVVLDTESIGGYKVFHLYGPFRIVVDVRRSEKEEDGTSSQYVAKRNARKGVRKADIPDITPSLARQLGLNVKTIVIDPGHGGKDPGCNSLGGIREKDLVLRLAKLLAKKIEREIGCEVLLTRNEDIFLDLERRTAIANMKKADLFISLHINAHRNKAVHGIETYFLNMATDKQAMIVAARENATSEKNISDLQAILNDLMLNTKISESSRLAYSVQGGMLHQVKASYGDVRDLGVKQAPFYVLIGAQMPAILVEAGFLTNARERKRLLSTNYQERIAQGICSGLQVYMKDIDKAYKGG